MKLNTTEKSLYFEGKEQDGLERLDSSLTSGLDENQRLIYRLAYRQGRDDALEIGKEAGNGLD